jgi:hypothetical protein
VPAQMPDLPVRASELEPERVAKLMQGVAMCIAIYQRIETHLKLLLPHMPHTHKTLKLQDPLDWRTLLDSKTTLGPLVGAFKKQVESDDAEGFAKYLTDLVDDRNDLVHAFFSEGLGKASSADELEKAIAHVRRLLHTATPFLNAMEDATRQFVGALDRSILVEELLGAPRNGDSHDA